MSKQRAGTDPSPMLEAALACAARGWSVIPMQARGKRPIVAWRAFEQQAAGPGDITRWFAHWTEANLGLVTGRVSGLVVVDVDPRHGGAESLAAAEAEHGPLLPTVEAATGGGGRHLYYAHPGGVVANRVALRPGIDLRGDGGCVVAPPSVHPNGRRYEWAAGRAPGQVPLAPLPPHFGGLQRPIGHSRLHWRRLVREGVDEGARNNTIASLAGHLMQRGVEREVVAELLLAWNHRHCRPPLAEAEVLRTVDSIARLHDAGDEA